MPETAAARRTRVNAEDIALPPSVVSVSQDREWCVVELDGRWKKIRFHDYDSIYAIPGLYETIFYDVLGCSSPSKMRELLERCVRDAAIEPRDLRVLDLGAGNGMVGEELSELGVEHIVGVDITESAAAAARRDRPRVYDRYFVLDMTELPEEDRARLTAFRFNGLICVAALGFGDIPPMAFAQAYNLVADGGWVAFNIKTEFLATGDRGGFAGLIRRMIEEELICLQVREQYEHRQATDGQPLLYKGIVGVKHRDVPLDWLSG